jgi:ribose transport system substrate-binding protein
MAASPSASTGARTLGEPVPGVAWDKDIPMPTCDLSAKKMAYVVVLRSNPVIQIMAQGAVDGAKAVGFGDAQWLAPEGFDEPAAVAMVDQAISQGIDGFVMFATSDAYFPVIKRAADKGIPVVQTHSPFAQGQAPGMLSVVAPDPAAFGATSAEAIAAELQRKGITSGSVAITQTALQLNENQGAAGFSKRLHELMPGLTILDPVAVGGDFNGEIAKETAIVQAHPDIVAAYGLYGNSPITYAQTMADTGKQFVVIGMDYAKANLDNVRDGKVYGIVAQPLYQEHYEASVILGDYICGQKDQLKYLYSAPAPVVLKDGLQPYYDMLGKVNIK